MAIIAFSFGAPESTANRWIAVKANLYAREWNVPIVTQKDITLPHPEGLDVYISPQGNGKYLTTLQLVKYFTELAKEKGWTEVVVVAADPHIKRCIRDLQKFGFSVSTAHFWAESLAPIKIKWFNKNAPDDQKHVRSLLRWWRREIIVRIMPWRLYDRLTG